MHAIPEGIRRFAEEPSAYLPDPPAPARRIKSDSFVLMLSPSPAMSVVSEIRTTDDALDETIEQVRGLVRENGYTRSTWIVGPSCTPVTLSSRLRQLGFRPAAPPLEPTLTAMALVEPPVPPPDGTEARLVADFDDFLTKFKIAIDAFGLPEEAAGRVLAAAPELWTNRDPSKWFDHLAVVDGEPVGFSHTHVGTIGLVLDGSGVKAEARGRGAYRALVAARWTEAVKLEKPALVVQAGSMSGPILERCGFERICELTMLDDPLFADDGP
jgi:hypothetical protein